MNYGQVGNVFVMECDSLWWTQSSGTRRTGDKVKKFNILWYGQEAQQQELKQIKQP